jgi:hypothetical protein
MAKKQSATPAKKATAPKTSKTSTPQKSAGTTKKAAVATRKTSTTNNTTRKTTKVTKTRTEVSVENGMRILQTAIKGNLSLSEASRRNSLGRNYLSDVKARIKENYKNKKINRETYQNFSMLLKTYNSL